MTQEQGGNRPEQSQISQTLRPVTESAGAGHLPVSPNAPSSESKVQGIWNTIRHPLGRRHTQEQGRVPGKTQEKDAPLTDKTPKKGRNRTWTYLMDHKSITLPVAGVVGIGGTAAGIFASGAFNSESDPNPEPGGGTPGPTLTIEPTKTEQPTLTATRTPTETATPTPKPELLPFTAGVKHEYAGGLIKTVADAKLLTGGEIIYETKSGIKKTANLSPMSDYFVGSEQEAQNLLNFSKDIQYRKWAHDNPEAANGVTFEQVLQAWNQGETTVNGVTIPTLKILTIGKSATPEALQLETSQGRYVGVREDEDNIALISAVMHLGTEGVDSPLGEWQSESNLALAAAAYIYGDLERGGTLDTINKDTEAGIHYWEELVPLGIELRDTYFTPNTILATPAQ